MIRSLASCRASSAAASAVASSGYPIAIKSAITPSLPSPASNPTQSTNPPPPPPPPPPGIPPPPPPIPPGGPHPPRVIPAHPPEIPAGGRNLKRTGLAVRRSDRGHFCRYGQSRFSK